VYAQFRYLDGAAAGRTRTAAADFATIGRHPESDVPFDPEADLAVSVRHAAVFKQGGGFLVRDLGSSNGTWLNGERVRGDRPLEAGDVLQFGPSGPRLEFTTVDTLPRPDEGPAAEPPAAARRRLRARPTDRILAPPRPRGRPGRWVAAGLVAAVAIASGQWAWQARQERMALEARRSALLGRVDDLVARLAQGRSAVPGIAAALGRARIEADGLRAAIASAPAAPALDSLGTALSAAAGTHGTLLAAAALDPDAATRPAARAVVLVVVEFEDGRVRSGTGFAARAAGDTVWFVTPRRLVLDTLALPPLRLVVIFAGTTQSFRAALARVHDSADAALLVARIRGAVPTVPVADAPAPGAAVAVVGFPGGLDSVPDWRTRGPGTAAVTATVVGHDAEGLRLDPYGRAVPLGGPVFAGGRVTGLVVQGGRGGVVAVPGSRLRDLFPGVSP
jgi:hypothetical protein